MKELGASLQATMNSEAKNMASVTFLKQLRMSRLQDIWITLDEQYGGILRVHYIFRYIKKLFIIRFSCLVEYCNFFL